MTHRNDGKNRRTKDPAEPERDVGENGKVNYEVGYGKPPKHTQFTKGRSGNPKGRPKKKSKRPIRLSDAVSDRFLEEEAYRQVTLRENGEMIQLPVLQAIMRSLTTNAVKGSRLSQKYFIEYVAQAEELSYRAKMDRYLRLRDLKRDGEESLERARRNNAPMPDLLPHPDDIVLDHFNGNAYINGPATEEDAKYYDHIVSFRNFLLLRSAHARASIPRGQRASEPGKACIFLVFAHLLDRFIPVRYQLAEMDAIAFMMECESLAKHARERRIEAEYVELLRFDASVPPLPPAVLEVLERVRKRWLHGLGEPKVQA